MRVPDRVVFEKVILPTSNKLFMLQYFLTFAFCVAASSLSAQTKLIAHKSHSGTVESFRLAYENNSPELENTNFGAAPERTVVTASLDSLIFISDSLAVMVTSKFCEKRNSSESKLWRAGRDTVRNHPLFSKQHALDSIKNILERRYHFKNSVDRIKFIGYDNKKDSLHKKDSSNCDTRYVLAPSLEVNQQKHGNNSVLIITGIAAFSLLSGTLSWMFSRNRS